GRVIVACAAVTSAAFVLFPILARDVVSASLLRLVAGFGLAGVYLPGVRVVGAAATAERRGLAVSAYVSAFYLGSAASLGLTGLMLPLLRWQGAALALGCASALAVPLTLWAIPGRTAAGPAVAGILRPAVLKSEPLLRVIVAYTGHAWELYVLRGWLAAFLAEVLVRSQGLASVAAVSEAGKWAALMYGLGTVGVWLGGWLSDRIGRARAAMLLAAGSGILSLLFGFLGGGGWMLLLAAGCVYGILTAGDSGIYSTAVTELAPADQIGSAQAMQAGLGFFAGAVSPVAAGAILDMGGGFGGAFVMAGLASLLAAAVLVPLARRQETR
ncbi:MAG: hypothetical protein KGJ86_09575, partial [Chloroflexota bacterium]|nr:hypothetical protein [Chloroflexota bacterium]